ncbi:MAG TPA: zf-HC2 domain-containing protein [Bacteroidota bacterium]
MKSHRAIQQQLYEFIHGELPEAERLAVEEHVAGCSRCAEELDTLREALAHLQALPGRPSEFRNELYWQQFAAKVERRIERAEEEDAAPSAIRQLLDAFVEHRKPFGVGFASALTLLMIGFGIWSYWIRNPERQQSTAGEVARQESSVVSGVQKVSVDSRAEDYLEQSKVLLIGIMNSDPSAKDQSLSISAREKELSRKLVSESEHLTSSLNDPSQRRLKELIGDLKLILVQIANQASEHNGQGIEIVRNGIEHNDILFKINLEEIQRTSHTAKTGGPNTQVKPTI